MIRNKMAMTTKLMKDQRTNHDEHVVDQQEGDREHSLQKAIADPQGGVHLIEGEGRGSEIDRK